MSYYLSKNDVKVLKQTINTVNNISTGVGQGKRPTIKNAFAYAELTEVDADGLWSAVEVYFDETGAPNGLEDGRTWGGEEPSIIVNGDVSAGQVMRVEAYYLVDSNDEEQAVWVGSAVGGGGTVIQRLQCKADITLTPNVLDTLNFRTVTFTNSEITAQVNVIQNKISQAFYEENETVYGEFDSVNNRYILDPFIFAQGIQNASI
jgi:hypothetical protein